MRRLARTVCADVEEIGQAAVMEIAKQACDYQLQLLLDAVERQSEKHSLSMVVAAGIGEKIIARACDLLDLRCTHLSDKYGRLISDIFPAYAVARLLESHLHIENPCAK
jgi:uncharacterized hydantoinase/oxoprolinase family protein